MNSAGLIRRRVVIRGRVQGVWFRGSCREAAMRFKVGGWVCNRPDGTVEAVFEGVSAAVEAMVDWCRVGPPRAQVTGVEVSDEDVLGEEGFSVR